MLFLLSQFYTDIDRKSTCYLDCIQTDKSNNWRLSRVWGRNIAVYASTYFKSEWILNIWSILNFNIFPVGLDCQHFDHFGLIQRFMFGSERAPMKGSGQTIFFTPIPTEN